MMAEHMDPILEAFMREESEQTRYDDYPPGTVGTRPNLVAEHTVQRTAEEERKLTDEVRRRKLAEEEIVRQWVAEHLV